MGICVNAHGQAFRAGSYYRGHYSNRAIIQIDKEPLTVIIIVVVRAFYFKKDDFREQTGREKLWYIDDHFKSRLT